MRDASLGMQRYREHGPTGVPSLSRKAQGLAEMAIIEAPVRVWLGWA